MLASTGNFAQMTFDATNNQIATIGSWGAPGAYDAAGNVIEDMSSLVCHTYQWDAEGRMKSVDATPGQTCQTTATTVSVFNALGQRVDHTGGGLHLAYLFHADGSELGDWDVTGNAWGNAYFNLNGRPIAKYMGGAAYFMHTNYLGSTTMVTDASGGTVEKKLYYPYGQEWVTAGTTLTSRFASLREQLIGGGQEISQSQTRDYPSRHYRWLSPDPIGRKAAKLLDPQTWNMYGYVRNSPTTLTDPTGLYEANCGNGVKNCAKQIQNLDKAIQNAMKSQNADIRKGAEAYGKLGDKNGVNVSIVKVVDAKHPTVAGSVTAKAGTGGMTYESGKFQQATQVTVKAGLSGKELESVAVHEGVHVEDRAAFVNSINAEKQTWNPELNITGRQSERNAYGVENLFWRSVGMPTRDIDAVLAQPPYSDNPNIDQPLFPGMVTPQ